MRPRILRLAHRLAPADAMGLRLFVRQALPEGPRRGSVVLVHGATLASGLWDIDVPGYSVLLALARAGFSTWAPDIRGYARSDRVRQPVQAYAGMREAVRDIDAVVAHACQHDRVDQVLLVGGSWGSITAAGYACVQPQRVCALALMAPIFASRNPLWLEELGDPEHPAHLRPDLGPTRQVGRPDLCRRWDPEIPSSDKARRREARVLDALMADALAAEPADAHPLDDRPTFTVPNGTLADLFEYFSGRPLYDPGRLHMPTLLVRGEDDQTSTAQDMDTLRSALIHAPVQCETIPDAGHFICAERAAPALQRTLADFLAGQAAQARVPG